MLVFCVASSNFLIETKLKVAWLALNNQKLLLGQPPFDMESAARFVEDLANNIFGRFLLLDVSRLVFGFAFDHCPPRASSILRLGVCPILGQLLAWVSVMSPKCKDKTWKLFLGSKGYDQSLKDL